jgi:LPXTG-motif cell wall-anchored protein
VGHTNLTDLGGNNWNVDSFFDVVYEIDFQGCPGSTIEGYAGTTQGSLRMETGEPPPPVPGLTGSWLVVFGAVLAGTAAYFVRRRQAA